MLNVKKVYRIYLQFEGHVVKQTFAEQILHLNTTSLVVVPLFTIKGEVVMIAPVDGRAGSENPPQLLLQNLVIG